MTHLAGGSFVLSCAMNTPTRGKRWAMSGTPMAEPLTDEAVAAMGRVVLEITVERAYGATHLPEA